MSTIQPEQAAFLLSWVLPAVKSEQRNTQSVIEAIPATNGDYKPDAASKTALEIAWHIAAAEQRFYSGVVAGEFDFSPITRPEAVRTGKDIGAWYQESFARNYEGISKLSGEQLAKIIDFRGVMQQPAVAFLDFSLRHTIHHRGQLTTYLRAMGGKVPAVYGESYDSAEAKKAAKAAS
jgi:uncharacterized damage-inducible protein DinB